MALASSSVARATDSGIEDTASYLEPSTIQLRESEFHEDTEEDDGSLMEGSVVDTDYADRILTKTSAESVPRSVKWGDVEGQEDRGSCSQADRSFLGRF